VLSRPAHLPNSLVRLAPDGFEVIKESAPDRRRPRDRRQAVQTGLKYCVGDFTVDIELELDGGGIANGRGTRAIEPGEPRHLPFDQASLPSKSVHDLQLIRTAGDSAQQPVPPFPCLVIIAGAPERQQCERGVPQPAVPVIPVAHTAGLLGERCRRRGEMPPVGA
jgi:hypothetical protein